MMTIDSELVAAFDIDDSILFEDANRGIPVQYTNPFTGKIEHRSYSEVHVEWLKELHARGYTIILWSAGSAKHCEAVARTLKIDKYVHFCVTKPLVHVDDKRDSLSIIGKRIFLEKEDNG